MRLWSGQRALCLAGALALFCTPQSRIHARSAPAPEPKAKLDRAVRRLVGGDVSAGENVPVIVQYKPGAHDSVARRVASHGDAVGASTGPNSFAAHLHKNS